MSYAATTLNPRPRATRLDRALRPFTAVSAGEGATALLMLATIFLLLVCYSIIKTVREPLILLGGGAEVRSYAAAGQALMLMAFVPAYSWLASRVGRVRLLVGVSVFFIAGIELFASAVVAGVPYVGVAFFIWVGIFNVSLIAQFWSFASDVYTKEAGDRLFPIIVMGMTAGAPLGSLVAGRLFHSGLTPPVILQAAAVLLAASASLYLWIDRRERGHVRAQAPSPALSASGGFQLVLANPRLRLIAGLIVLLNVVNTTGEYLVARLLTVHVNALAALDAGFDKQAYIGAFSGDYQFWVNVTALILQAFVTSRLVKYRGLRGALLALPLIALGGYAIVAAGAGFSLIRWIKTAENATDYSVMNTARQLLWLPATREEKYKAKQAIDTFLVRGGDVLSAGVVYLGAQLLHLGASAFAIVNVALTIVWIGVALRIVAARYRMPRAVPGPALRAAAAVAVLLVAAPGLAQQSREELLSAQQARKAVSPGSDEADALERSLERIDGLVTGTGAIYPFIGGIYDGGGLAVGPGYRRAVGDTGSINAHAAWSLRNYKAADVALSVPAMWGGRLRIDLHANWKDAPNVAFYGTGNRSVRSDRVTFSSRTTTVGASARVSVAPRLAIGGGLDSIQAEAGPRAGLTSLTAMDPTYLRTHLFAEFDGRQSPGYTRRGGLYRVDWFDYRQTNTGALGFHRLDAEIQQFVPVLRESRVIALRALASTTTTDAGQSVPYFLMPELGGSHALRGYPAWRFRDRNRLLMSAEYRWTAGPFVDMALFVDAGKVAARAGDLDLRGLKTSYGIGLSLHTLTHTMTRIELARTREGTRIGLSFSPSF